MIPSPVYANCVEIKTIITPGDGEIVEFRFFFEHPNIENGKVETDFPQFKLTLGPTVIMSRKIAKGMLRDFLYFMTKQEKDVEEKNKSGKDGEKKI